MGHFGNSDTIGHHMPLTMQPPSNNEYQCVNNSVCDSSLQEEIAENVHKNPLFPCQSEDTMLRHEPKAATEEVKDALDQLQPEVIHMTPSLPSQSEDKMLGHEPMSVKEEFKDVLEALQFVDKFINQPQYV